MNLIKLSAKLLFGITVLLIVFPLATFVGCSGWPSSQDVREAFLKGRTTGKFLLIDNLDPNSIVVKKSSAKDVWDITYVEKTSWGSAYKYHIQVVPKKRKQGGYLLHIINSEEIRPPKPTATPEPKPSYHKTTTTTTTQKPVEPEVDMATLTGKLKSFAGFTFGYDYHNNPPNLRTYHEPGHRRAYYLTSPFRYLNQANLYDEQDRVSQKRRALVQVVIFGVLPQEYTAEEINKEYAAVAKILEDKYGIKMKKVSNIQYNYKNGGIEIELWCRGDSHNMFVRVKNVYPWNGVEFRKPNYSAPKKFSPNEGANAL